MRVRILFLTLLFLAIGGQKAYGQLRNLSLISYEIVSYNAFTDKLTLNLTVRNDSTDFVIRSFTGLVYQNREPLLHLTSANVFVSHGISTIGVVCKISRCLSVPIWRLAQCFLSFDINEYSVDVAVVVQYPSMEIQYKEKKDISLSTRIDLH